MFETLVRSAGNIVRCTFIPVVYAAPSELDSKQNENFIDRLKMALVPGKYDGISPEVANFMTWIQSGTIFGCATGGAIHFKNQYMDFMENAYASQYRSHLDAKAAISSRMLSGAIRGAFVWGTKCTILTSTYAFLHNIIPIIRNEHSWPEYIIPALITGTLAGHLFCDPIALGFEEKKITGRLTYRQLCFAKGIGIGLFFGILTAAHANLTGSRSPAIDLRKWEKYWNQRRQKKDATSD